MAVLVAPAVVQLTQSLECSTFEYSVVCGGSFGSADHASDCFDARTITRVRNLVHAVIRAPELRDECDDCIQEALIGLWKRMRKNPGRPVAAHLACCRCYILDSLKRGRSLDSAKRRRQRLSIDCKQHQTPIQQAAQLISSVDPLQEASANDDVRAMWARLSARDQSILNLFLQGHGTREVALELHMSPSGVGKSKSRIRLVATQIGLAPKIRGGPWRKK